MIPSILMETGAARKELCLSQGLSMFSPSLPQLLHLPGGTYTDLNVRNINIEHI